MDEERTTLSDVRRFEMEEQPEDPGPSCGIKIRPNEATVGHRQVRVVFMWRKARLKTVELISQGQLEKEQPASPARLRIIGPVGPLAEIELKVPQQNTFESRKADGEGFVICGIPGDPAFEKPDGTSELDLHASLLLFGTYVAEAKLMLRNGTVIGSSTEFKIMARPLMKADELKISMDRATNQLTLDQALWVAIRRSTERISFHEYDTFVKSYVCSDNDPGAGDPTLSSSVVFPFGDMYKRLKQATELFLIQKCGVKLTDIEFAHVVSELSEESSRLGRPLSEGDIKKIWEACLVEVGDHVLTLPYLGVVVDRLDGLIRPESTSLQSKPDAPREELAKCYGIVRNKLSKPFFLELIWSYWHEEGMLVHALNAVSRRFQNKRRSFGPDPLARLDIDPLRPLNNLLWAYVADEQHQLTINRRACEYSHLYGFSMEGKTASALATADCRSQFLEALHTLLYVTSVFYKESDDTTVVPDGFPVLRALKDLHMLLAEGAHNQFGDLPSTARMEMLMQQWLLARREMREFLGGRTMMPYRERWMDSVDTMKKLQGWTDVSIVHFNDLARFGENILWSVRYGNWNMVENPQNAHNWALYWRPDIQGYSYAYRAVTGIDLTSDISYVEHAQLRDLPPAVHLRKRLAMQMRAR
jgi:hypothetical protein